MKEKKPKKQTPWDYLWYALYAFAGLGLELLLLGLVEPLFFGKAGTYNDLQSISHWVLTVACWAGMLVYLSKSAAKELNFQVANQNPATARGMALALGLVAVCVALNAWDWGTLKIVGEFHKKGPMLFAFQYLYYVFEVGLVFLIVAFGQAFGEALLKGESKLPFGGFVLCLTWGAVHILSQGSLATGLGVMVFGVLYGLMYVVLNKNTRLSYLAMLLAFII